MLRFLRFFEDITIDDVALVGAKNASLGQLYRELNPKGVRVPYGFAITAEAYRYVRVTLLARWPRRQKRRTADTLF